MATTSEVLSAPVSTPVWPDGLSAAEAKARLEKFGPNELSEKNRNPLLELFSRFWGPIPWMIEAAAILSALVRHWADFIIIMVLLLANAVVGFWEEFQAGNAIAALKANLALRARAKRDGTWKEILARELVPDDLIHLRLGDIVPADAKLLERDQECCGGGPWATGRAEGGQSPGTEADGGAAESERTQGGLGADCKRDRVK